MKLTYDRSLCNVPTRASINILSIFTLRRLNEDVYYVELMLMCDGKNEN